MAKRMTAVILLCVLLIGMLCMLTGCVKVGSCEECGQTGKLTKFKFKDASVEWLYDDCLRLAKFLTSW